MPEKKPVLTQYRFFFWSISCCLEADRGMKLYVTHLSLGFVQHKSLVPVIILDFADVELHLGALLVLHRLPFVQSHLLGAFVLHFLSLILPSTQHTQ